MITRPFKTVDRRELNKEIQALGLPGFRGSGYRPGELTFRFDDDLALTEAQLAALDQAIATHVPPAPPVPRDWQAEIQAARTVDDLKALMADLVAKRGL